MPELPEVETIRRSLLPLIKGQEITKIEIFHKDVLINEDQRPLQGWIIADLRRRGKYLMIDIISTDNKETGALLIVHFRMTGKLLYQTEQIKPSRHTHVRFHLEGDRPAWLDYEDVRRFGRIWLLPAGGESKNAGLAGLGPEPLSKAWTLADFQNIVNKSKAPIKSILLNQKVVAGVGNIYCDEALFRAKVLPARKADSLSTEEIKRLHEAVQYVIKEGIGHRGTSFRDYVDGLGGRGHFQQQLQVYQRAGEECKICGSEIAKVKVAGRGTHYCPRCQM
ncbi:MAG TPA: bifunctional DNA-formamidopyrimidine glycosylase/DNA-(apurinic or apyrimidinic site) lyase [Clostridiaceae bacterium]|nr:bifunctional DNA-formamidopyrimidine glycosylase/DNA-(apurinic or apyrimidinic site) lyase [Clostridiaceae bacterium]